MHAVGTNAESVATCLRRHLLTLCLAQAPPPLVNMAATISREQSSFANYEVARASDLVWTIAVDFHAKVIRSTATWIVTAAAGTGHVVFDTNHLVIHAVRVGGEKPHASRGTAVLISHVHVRLHPATCSLSLQVPL